MKEKMEKTLRVINKLVKEGLIEDYAIGGGIAAIFYIEPFLTYDMDIFIIVSRKQNKNIVVLTPVFKYLENLGYSWKGEHIVIEDLPVQFIAADELEKEAVNKAREIKFKGVKTKILSPEYLITVLFRVGRKKDFEKIDRILEQSKINRKELEDLLERYNLIKKFKDYYE
jgi:hypothetical protein